MRRIIDGLPKSKNGLTFIIAEIGTSHGRNIGKAVDLIHAARDSGADCAKFQLVIAKEILHPDSGIVPLPSGDIQLFARFQELEAPIDFYSTLKEKTESAGLRFLCSPFGIESARILRTLDAQLFKIASPELNHMPLLRELSSYSTPVILSTGVSTLSDIEYALAFFSVNASILHCITSYPAPPEEYNLRVIKNLSSIFGIRVGISDHSLDPILVPSLSIAMGATIVEKHICLSRNDAGLDDPIALDPFCFKRMTTSIREAEKNGEESTIGLLNSVYGAEMVEAVLGDGVKRLAASEQANYARSNRSIHALRDIDENAEYNFGNIAVLRTEKVLRPGVHPRFYDCIIGRKARRSIKSGDGIQFEDF